MAFESCVEPAYLQRVRANSQLVVQRQFLLHAAVEGRAGQANHYNHHADVNDIAAITPRVAPDQLKRRPEIISPALPGNHHRPA